jgi:hypothetical protein
VKFHSVFAAVVIASLSCPLAAQAQGIPDGVQHGVYVGNQAAGPVGAVVGGAVGGVIGGVEGFLGVRPVYAAYPVAEPHVYRHPRWVRHSYRHIGRRHTAG